MSQLLSAEKNAILLTLADAKYDKIVHVRQAANKALRLIEDLPDAVPGQQSSSAEQLQQNPALPDDPSRHPPPDRQAIHQFERCMTIRDPDYAQLKGQLAAGAGAPAGSNRRLCDALPCPTSPSPAQHAVPAP